MRLVRRWITVAVLVLVPVAMLVVFRTYPRTDLMWFSPEWHLVIVAGIAACALLAAFAALVTAARSGQPNIIWLGIGCVAVGLGMLGHGLTMPGVFGHAYDQWVGRLPYLAMCVFALCLFAAGRSPSWGPNRFIARHPLPSMVVPTLTIAALVAMVSARPTALNGVTAYTWEENTFDVVSIVTVALLAFVVRTHWRRWHLGHDVFQFAIVLAATASIAAIVAFEHGQFQHVSWWDYHGYLMAGFGGAIYAVFRRRGDERSLTQVLNSAFVDDPFEHIVSGYPEALRSLVRAVEVKDTYTHGHSERTAKVAVELGARMGLPADRLRVIARGAYLHDLGKIGISNEILNKPGALDAAERRIMETHPRLGYELASGAPTLREALPVILHHHERIDGGGYPEGLRGSQIPLEARVVAVADVWDALTSDRAYRAGWEPARALAHIDAGRGTHFDPRVVDAFVALAADWGIAESAEPGQAEVAWNAAQTCHEVVPERELVSV